MPTCAICGQDATEVTQDHIPPKSIFGKNPDYNLITVPSCKTCQGTSKDDEYFKLLAVEWNASSHPTAANVMDSVRRSLQRPQQRGYRAHLMQKTKRTDLVTPGGLFIKPGGELSVNVGRLAKTATKIVKGLYYYLKGKPVPDGYFAYCSLLDFMLDGGPADFVKDIRSVLPVLASAPVNTIGPEVFCYRVGLGDKDPDSMFVIWELYNRYQFFGFVVREDGKNQAKLVC